MRRLEAELGAVLLTRSVRGIVLTPIGKAFLARARAIDRDLRQVRDEITQFRGTGEGSLSVGASTAPAIGVLPNAAIKLRAAWPRAHIRISDTSFPNVLADLREGRFDMALSPRFGPKPVPAAEFAVKHLFDNEVVVAVRKGHPLARAKSLRELTSAEWMRSGPVGGPSTVIDDAYRSIGLPPPECHVQCESFLALPEVLSMSDGVALVPWQILEQPGTRHRLVRVPVRETLKPTKIDLLMRAGVPLTPIARDFVDILTATAKR